MEKLLGGRDQFNPESPSNNDVLECLQVALDEGLNYRTGRVQLSTVSALTEVRWAEGPLVVRFMQAISTARVSGKIQTFSARSPYCQLLQDTVVLLPVLSFLPKVAWPFHNIGKWCCLHCLQFRSRKIGQGWM